MKSFESWMNEYGESHTHPTNQIIHKIMVPAIMWTILGLMWIIPTPDFMNVSPLLNWSTIFGLFCMVFYLTLNLKMFFGMIFMIVPMYVSIYYMAQVPAISIWKVMTVVFIIAWIFQFVGHKIEGKKPSFLKDLLFLLIGPLWVLRSFYRVIGVQV
ncbi:MAG: DUF962 domain-containing protein [Bacteriovoracaceae bacterium]|nr:DUF962 domain-containing protein [Bacteriovoracaceae bacterium]